MNIHTRLTLMNVEELVHNSHAALKAIEHGWPDMAAMFSRWAVQDAKRLIETLENDEV